MPKLLIKIALTILIFYWINSKIKWDITLDILKSINATYLIAAILMIAFSLSLGGLRHYKVCYRLNLSPTLSVIHKLSWKASFFNQFLPGGIGGDGYKALVLIKLGNDKTISLMSILLDRFIGTFPMIILSFLLNLLVSLGNRIFLISRFIFDLL